MLREQEESEWRRQLKFINRTTNVNNTQSQKASTKNTKATTKSSMFFALLTHTQREFECFCFVYFRRIRRELSVLLRRCRCCCCRRCRRRWPGGVFERNSFLVSHRYSTCSVRRQRQRSARKQQQKWPEI